MALFLDTSVVIDFLRGAQFGPALIAREPLLISPVTVHEVLVGVRTDEEGSASNLLDGLMVVPAGRREAVLSAAWRRQFANEGLSLALTDTLVAAAALVQGLPLATANVKHFPMPELRVEEWSSEQ